MRAAELHVIFGFCLVLSLADVDQILQDVGKKIDAIAPEDRASKYKVNLRFWSPFPSFEIS